MDENELFRQCTLRICGNLEIEEALFSSIKFLRQEMPVDRLFLQFQDADLNALRIIAMATIKEAMEVDLLTPLSPKALQAQKDMVNEYRQQDEPNFMWLFQENPEQNLVIREVFELHKLKATSLMVLPLKATGEILGGGSIVLTTEGDRKFTQQHAEMLSLLKEPFSIAMSNALKHRNELKLFDREFFFEVTKRICGTLEIEQGLQDCLQYISNYMPADRMYLQRYQPDLNSMHLIARADKDHYEKMNQLIPFNDEAKNKLIELSEIWRKGELPPILVINKPADEPVTKCMLEALNEPMSSALSLPLIVENIIIGTLVLLAKGDNRYNEEHAKLFTVLKLPFFVALSNTLKHREVINLKELLADDNRYLKGELRRLSGDKIIGVKYGLKNVMFQVQQVAKLDSPVLLLGETGVGKDVIANAIHYSSPRKDGPFVSVNCGAIPDSLIDSELFGHEKGAFTGALTQKKGRFERANNGTIFLDEIGELPLEAQVRLLKVLQDKEIERVGGTKTIHLDIRFIAATNRNLEEMIAAKQFREDLWFRLNVFPIHIPPLRDRRSDIPDFLQHFITQKAKELNLSGIPTLAPGVIDVLMNYHWPGNVRELENIIERSLILNPSGPLSFEHIIQPKKEAVSKDQEQMDDTLTLDEMTSRYIRKVLSKTKGKIHGKGGAAELLGINANTLRNRMNKLGIDYGKSKKYEV